MNLGTAIMLAKDFSNLDMGQRMMKGLEVTGVGILTVFVILMILILCIKLMDLFIDNVNPGIASWFGKTFKKKSKKQNTKNLEQVAKVTKVEETEQFVDDKKVVAAVTAAVMNVLETETDGRKPNIRFKVRSIKKI